MSHPDHRLILALLAALSFAPGCGSGTEPAVDPADLGATPTSPPVEEMGAPDLVEMAPEVPDQDRPDLDRPDQAVPAEEMGAPDMPELAPLGFEPTPGDHTGEFVSGERTRTFTLRLPPGYDPAGSHPVVFVFHGGNGDGAQIKRALRFDPYTDADGAIGVYPDGVEKNWADGRGTTDASQAGVDDVTFVRELLDHLSGHLAVDPARVWATGASNGGLMSQRLGCDLADRIAAIAPVIASVAADYVDACVPARPMPVLAIQGTEDAFMTFEGGDSTHDRLGIGDGGPVLGVLESARFWAERAGCTGEAEVTDLAPVVLDDPTRVEHRRWSMCEEGAVVDYYIVDGMGHTWPPRSGQSERVSGPPSSQLDATALVWAFFTSRPVR